MLFQNDVLTHKDTGSLKRVVRINPDDDEVWLFDLGDEKALPTRCSLAAIETMQSTGYLALFAGTDGQQVITPSEAAIRKRDEAYKRIKPLTEDPDIVFPGPRSLLVNARADELACSPQTLYQDLRNWWRNGQTTDALLPKFHLRGSTAGTTNGRGRPARYLTRQNYQITEKDQALMKDALENIFLKNDITTLSACFQQLLENHYRYADGEGHLRLYPEGERPSEQQFRYFAKKMLPHETVIRRRKGDATFELEHRAKLGSLQHQTYTVGDAYEIDSTIADYFIVSRRNRAAIIGKPTLYFIFDRKSWLIVGFYVGLENPCWPAAMQAIKTVSEDKEALCKRYGVEYDPADWPAHGVFPKEFIADRGGEMMCYDSTQIVEGLDIVVRNLPSRRADQKPMVECGFKLIQRSMADTVPGYKPPEEFGKRQTKQRDQEACMNLDEFTATILKAIIRFNKSPRKDYSLAAEHVFNGMQPIPRDIWNLEIRRRAGALARRPEERIRFALLPKAKATVTREGIRLGTCYYTCEEATKRGWFVAAGRGEFTVNASFDSRLVDTIYVHDDKDPTKFFVATLLDRCSDYRGLSVQEVVAIEFQRKILGKVGDQISRQNMFEFHQQVRPVTQQAMAEMKQATKGKTRSSRKKDIAKDRDVDRREERQTKARIPRPASSNEHTEMAVPSAPLPAQQTSIPTQKPAAASDRDARRRQKLQELMKNGH